MKRALDIVASLIALAVLALPMLVVALCVKLGSRGPVLFHATRTGRGGRPFRLHKFRTMTDGAGGPSITTAGDTRVTAVGRVLRRLLQQAPGLSQGIHALDRATDQTENITRP